MLHIHNANQQQLSVNGTLLTGALAAGGGMPRELFIHRASKSLCWVTTAGQRVAVAGTDIGVSPYPQGSLFLSGGALHFSLDGRLYRASGAAPTPTATYRNAFAADIVIRVYTNAARTQLAATLQPGQSANVTADSVYLTGTAPSGVTDQAQVDAVTNGRTYQVTGSYTSRETGTFYWVQTDQMQICADPSTQPEPLDPPTAEGQVVWRISSTAEGVICDPGLTGFLSTQYTSYRQASTSESLDIVIQ